jgi:hypothetical protein
VAAYPGCLSDDILPSAKNPQPGAVTQHDRVRCAGLVVAGLQCTAERRLDAEDVEVGAADDFHESRFRAAGGGHGLPDRAERRDVPEGGLAVAVVTEVGPGECVDWLAATRIVKQVGERRRLAHARRRPERGADHRVDRRGATDAQREGRDGKKREQGRGSEPAPRVHEVTAERLPSHSSPAVSRSLFHNGV